MKKYTLSFFVLVLILVQSCRDTIDIINPVTPVSYKEIVSVNMGELNLKLFITGEDSLSTGYNDLYMKVTKNNVEQTKGYIKFFPKMWMTPTFMHSTAVSERFNYDAGTGYYRGYAIFNMVTDPPAVVWYGVFTYVDENNVSTVSDTTPMYTRWDRKKQWSFIFDSVSQANYMVSLVYPFNPKKGMNDIGILVHKTNGFLLEHQQINDAQMFISVYKLNTTVTATGNVNPTAGADGIYRGKFNLPDTGIWKVCDSIYYENHWITNNPPPMPEFYYELH